MLTQIKRIIRRVIPKPAVQQVFVNIPNSFSQAGEDLVLEFLFNEIGMLKPSYLELGVLSPDNCSNTFKFYQKGGRGVLVEADETLVPMISEKRPEDIVLNVGVGVSNQKEADFFIFDNNGLNTFDEKEARFRNDQGTFKIQRVVKVPLKPVTEIIREHFNTYPDFLSIDIEGLDLTVLKSIDFLKYPIPIICAETCTYSENHIKPKDKSIEEFLLRQGYFVYADTYINTIFAHEQWFKTAGKK